MTQSYAHNMGKRKQSNLFKSFAKRPCHRFFSDDSNSSTVSTSTNSSDTGSDEDNSCDKNDNSLPICDSVNDVTSTASSSSSSNNNTPSKSLASVTVTDIGSLDIQHAQQLSDAAKLKLLKYGFQPDKSWSAPARLCGKIKRGVAMDFFDAAKYPPLRYSVSQDGIYIYIIEIYV